MKFSVCYAHDKGVWIRYLDASTRLSAQQALQLSGFFSEFPSIDVNVNGFGVFGQPVGAQELLNDGDRIEVYRPLSFDPKVSRRRRATHREKNRTIKKKVPINDQTAL